MSADKTIAGKPVHIVHWKVDGIRTTQGRVQHALIEAGFDKKMSRERLPRHAWARAMQKCKDKQLVEVISEDDKVIRFQFNVKDKTGPRAEYPFEAILVLAKKDGKVTPEEVDGVVPANALKLAGEAQTAVLEATAVRNGRDISALIRRLMTAAKVDLHPACGTGMFVIFGNEDAIDNIDRFMKILDPAKDRCTRLKVDATDKATEKSVGEAVAVTMEDLIAKYKKAVADMCAEDAKTRPSTFKKAAERVQEAILELNMYRAVLKDKAVKFDAELSALREDLGKKVKVIDEAAKPAVTEAA
jgi:hypothetical protein